MNAQLLAFVITLAAGLALLTFRWRWARLEQPPEITISNAEHTRLINDPAAKLSAARRIGWGGVVMGLVLLVVAGLIAGTSLG